MKNLHEFITEFMNSKSKDEKIIEGHKLVKSNDPEWVKFSKKDGETGRLFSENYIKKGYDFRCSLGEMNRSYVEVYYLAIFHKESKQTIKDGVYIAYLLPNDHKELLLCLMAGVASADGDMGILSDRIEAIRRTVDTSYFKEDLLDDDFIAEGNRAIEYRQSVAYYKKYSIDSIPDNEILEDDLNKMYELYEKYIDSEVSKMSNDSIPVEKTIDVSNYIDTFKQIVFTGSPGTGKTYTIREGVKAKCKDNLEVQGRKIDQYKFVQFHSSYDYTDFVEGLRPIEINNRTSFVRMDGIFKEFCRNVVEYNLEQLGLSNIDELYINLTKESDHNIVKIKDSINSVPFYFIIDEINRADLGKVFGELMFGLEESYRGVENRFLTQYSNLRTYYIDKEDESKSGYFSEIKFTNGVIREDVFKNGFFIPENLHIIGSMNDIDRSVESFDFALRRRFNWINISANEVMDSSLKSIFSSNNINISNEDRKELVDKIISLNNVISSINGGGQFGLNDAYHIGPAYFKEYDPNMDDSMQNIWDNRIKPILLEYVRGRKIDKVAKFISDCAQSLDSEISLSHPYKEED